MRNEFTAIIEEGENGWWVATCPEVPPAVGQGRTVEEAREELESAVAFVLEYQRDMANAEASPAAIRRLLTVG